MKRALSFSLKFLWALLVLSVPLLGFWLVSSLAVYFNGPLWLAVVAGLSCFLVLPLGWDAWSNMRRRKRAQPPPKRRLSDRARILARVYAVNLLLIGALLAFYPRGSFEALSTRGDWMIERRSGPIYDRARDVLFFTADRLEWLYVAAQEEPIVEARDDVLPAPPPRRRATFRQTKVKTATITEMAEAQAEPADARRDRWPMSKKPHPVVASIPAEVESSHQSVARYIAENEPDPYLRIKAIHDYLAHRISYDVKTLRSADPAFRASQDPKTVFETRLAVCDGYSQLFEAMVEEIGGQAEYIGGESRDSDGSVRDGAHAWNAVLIEGVWYLVDVTWDAGIVEGDRFERRYSTDYLLTPPELFVVTHFPSHERWQLLEEPISRGEFLRKPMLRPSFHAQGLALVSPDRSQVTVDGRSFEIVLENPGMFYLIGTVRSKPETEEKRCTVRYEKTTAKIQCELPAAGEYVVRMYGSKVAHGSYPMIGTFDVNSG